MSSERSVGMKSSIKKMLAACLCAGVLGSSSAVLGSAANYQYVFSSESDEEESSAVSAVKVVADVAKKTVIVAAGVVAAGSAFDMYKNGGYRGSKTKEFVGKAGELAKLAYFVPKEYVAGNVLPKIGENEKFKNTKEYLSTNSENAGFVGEMKGLGSALKELASYGYNASKDYISSFFSGNSK